MDLTFTHCKQSANFTLRERISLEQFDQLA